MAEGPVQEGGRKADFVPSGAPKSSELDHERLGQYVRRLFAREDDQLRAVRARADRAGLPQIQLPPATARVVQVLVRAAGAKNVLEVGTLAGYSGVWVARALPPDGRLITLEINEDHAAVARRSFAQAGVADKAEVRVGKAMALMAEMGPAGSYDVVFLDADKESYPGYLQEAARLLRSGGILLADNSFWKGQVLAPGDEGPAAQLHRFNEMLAADERFDATIVPVGDGLMVAVRK